MIVYRITSKRIIERIVAEADAGVDNDVLRQIKMLKNSRDGLKTIHTRGTLNIVVWVSNPTYPLRLVRFQLVGRVLERRGAPGRMGTDLCSATVGGTELTYRLDLIVGQRPIYMGR